MNNDSTSGLVKLSAVCSLVPMLHTQIFYFVQSFVNDDCISDVFCSRRKYVRFRDGNATLFIFEDFTKDFWLWKMNILNKLYFLHHLHKIYYAMY